MDGPVLPYLPACCTPSGTESGSLSGPLLAGFAPYITLLSLGSGSFGEAILAHHPHRPSHLVVLKVSRGDDLVGAAEASRLLRDEAGLLRTLHHPRIVSFLDYVENPGRNFIVMTYVAGGSLADVLSILPGSRLPVPRVARLLLDVIQALEHVHMNGVLHLDVKPSNILFNTMGDALLSDFGLSRFAVNNAAPWVGSRPYVAPEALHCTSSFAAPVTAKADVWSPGVVIYEALTGSRSGASADDVVRMGPSWSLPGLPESVESVAALAAVLRLMLAVDPGARPDCRSLLLHPAIAPIRLLADSVSGVSSSGSAVTPARKRLLPLASASSPPPSLARLVSSSSLRLPPLPNDFVGRRVDMATLRACEPSGGGVVLTGLRGMGGIGKSALAIVLAHEWAPRFPDAQIFLDGRSMQPHPPSAEALLEAVLCVLCPDMGRKMPEGIAALRAAYLAQLDGRRVLVVLDNAADTTQAKPLTPPAGCAFIVTSRNSILLGSRAPLLVDRLPDDESAALLRTFVPGLSDADASTLARLCAGLPLALRLAGAHLAFDAASLGGAADVTGYVALLARGGRIDFLDEAAEKAGEETIRSTLRASEVKLLESERDAWHKLCVFSSSFDASAAEAVAGATRALLLRLAERSLVERAGPDHFFLHDLSAEYAQLQLSMDALSAVRAAYVQHYTALCWRASELFLGGRTVDGLSLFDRDRPHIESAFVWLSSRVSDNDYASQLVRLVSSVSLVSRLRFHPQTQSIPWFQALLGCARRLGDRKNESVALCELGEAFKSLGNPHKAIEYHEQAFAISREVGDRCSEASHLGNLGETYRTLGDSRKAIEFFEGALAICREVGDRRGEGVRLGNLGEAYHALSDSRKAIEFIEQALAISREVGDRRSEGNDLGNLGEAFHALGDSRRAITFLEQALAISCEVRDRRGESVDLGNLGRAYDALGESYKAIEFLEKALEISREVGDRRREGVQLSNLGRAYHALGDPRKAIEFLEQALVISREVGDRRGEGVRLGYLGGAYLSLQDPRKAITFYEQALAVSGEVGDRRRAGKWMFAMALLFRQLGNEEDALSRAEASLAVLRSVGCPDAIRVDATLVTWRAVPSRSRSADNSSGGSRVSIVPASSL